MQRGLLGDGAPLRASSMQRLTEDWQLDDAQWRTHDLSALEPVYVWSDGIYVKAGLESTKAALLVLIVALADGTKVVLAVESVHRESSESWAEILRDLTARGLPARRPSRNGSAFISTIGSASRRRVHAWIATGRGC